MISEFLITIFLVMLSRKQLKKDGKIFKNNFRDYVGCIIFYLTITVLIEYISFSIFKRIVGSISANQAKINEIPLLQCLLMTVFLSPISEEIAYRYFIRNFIHGLGISKETEQKKTRRDRIFIICSTVVFGIMHMWPTDNLLQYIYILNYAFAGYVLAKIYVKTNNIFCPIMFHSVHNLISFFVNRLLG